MLDKYFKTLGIHASTTDEDWAAMLFFFSDQSALHPVLQSWWIIHSSPLKNIKYIYSSIIILLNNHLLFFLSNTLTYLLSCGFHSSGSWRSLSNHQSFPPLFWFISIKKKRAFKQTPCKENKLYWHGTLAIIWWSVKHSERGRNIGCKQHCTNKAQTWFIAVAHLAFFSLFF